MVPDQPTWSECNEKALCMQDTVFYETIVKTLTPKHTSPIIFFYRAIGIVIIRITRN